MAEATQLAPDGEAEVRVYARNRNWHFVGVGGILRKPRCGVEDLSMACADLVAACFVDAAAPLAVPELNRERTLKYLECCYQQGLSWDDAERQIEDCLAQMGVPREGVIRQLKLAKPLLQPWLD